MVGGENAGSASLEVRSAKPDEDRTTIGAPVVKSRIHLVEGLNLVGRLNKEQAREKYLSQEPNSKVDNYIRLLDPHISGLHCVLSVGEGGVSYLRLAHTNKDYISGVPVSNNTIVRVEVGAQLSLAGVVHFRLYVENGKYYLERA